MNHAAEAIFNSDQCNSGFRESLIRLHGHHLLILLLFTINLGDLQTTEWPIYENTINYSLYTYL